MGKWFNRLAKSVLGVCFVSSCAFIGVYLKESDNSKLAELLKAKEADDRKHRG